MALPARDSSGALWLDTPAVYRPSSGVRPVKDLDWLAAHAAQADVFYLFPSSGPGGLAYTDARVRFRRYHDAVLVAISDREHWTFVAPFVSRADLLAWAKLPIFAHVEVHDRHELSTFDYDQL